MESLYLLIPVSVLIVGVAVWVFFRMADSGQFDDMDSPAQSILLDDDRPAMEPSQPRASASPDTAVARERRTSRAPRRS